MKLEHQFTAEGEVTLVFLNGFRMPMRSWDQVVAELPEGLGLLRYNRFGVGQSARASAPQDGDSVIQALRNLLIQLSARPPYILVAHSLGGLFANYYARVYSQEVAAVVFVESSHPEEIDEQKSFRPPQLLEWVNKAVKAIEMRFDRYRYSEDEMIDTTLLQLQQAGSFPEIPVAVLSGAKRMPFMPERAFGVHRKYQEKLLAISPLSKGYPCSQSGHFPQITEPVQVAEAIMETVRIAAGSA
jgi:pimeloyl-ACP methyl ester carboxylesterase